MPNKKQDNESRLGHDPLEWLEEDIANLTTDEDEPANNQASDAEAQNNEPSIETEETAIAEAPHAEVAEQDKVQNTPEPHTAPEAVDAEMAPEMAPEIDTADTAVSEKTSSSEDASISENTATPEENLSTASNELIPGFKLSRNDGVLNLPERLSVQVAEVTHLDWLQILDIEDLKTLQINAGKLSEIDAAGLQLMLAFTQALEKQSTKVSLTDTPDNIETIFKLAGLGDFFASLMEAA